MKSESQVGRDIQEKSQRVTLELRHAQKQNNKIKGN